MVSKAVEVQQQAPLPGKLFEDGSRVGRPSRISLRRLPEQRAGGAFRGATTGPASRGVLHCGLGLLDHAQLRLVVAPSVASLSTRPSTA